MQQWEYAVLERRHSDPLTGSEEDHLNGKLRGEWAGLRDDVVLNDLGRHGWELAGLRSGMDWTMFYFKRPKL